MSKDSQTQNAAAAEPISVIIVGMGARASIYSTVALTNPELLRVVGVVDVNAERVEQARIMFDLPEDNCFSTIEELLARPKMADAVINCTMDRLHVSTSIPLLRHGYDMLLEKPYALNDEEGQKLINCVQETGRKVMVCHILRYTPFYRALRRVIATGVIGEVINIHMANQVGYLHESVSFVRGKYAREEVCGSGMLLTKCSHDLDIMSWLMGNNVPTSISSVGGVFQFKEEKAPEGAGTHCLNDCQLERECPFSARRLYIEHPMRWSNNVWHDTGTAPATDAEKEKILRRPDNPFSRCVHRCNISIVDHQSVLIHYQDGAIGTFTMNGGASTPRRLIHVTGTRGEIYGTFEDECFCVRQIEPGAPGGYTERTLDMSDFQQGDAHGGGDRSIVLDFVALLRGERTSPGCPTLEDSITGHRMVFLAEESRMRGGAMLPW
ncbi:MAG: Gfo/Idh/MocA family oxidoreductase [Akkermansia sp.]|nr:Gfo/Idh/MocA family oxidoreductase [Akkermansia sp.]